MTSTLLGVRRVADLSRTPDVARLWATGGLAGLVRWTEVLVIGIYTYQHTGSPFLVALMAFANAIPNVLAGALVGALAERVDRKRLLIAGYAYAFLQSGVLVFLALGGRLELWHVGVATFLSGLVWTTEYPVRRTLLGEAAGAQRAAAGLSFDITIGTAALFAGPFLGGFLLRFFGLHAFYVMAMGAYALAIVALGSMRSSAPLAEGARVGLFEMLIDGIAQVSRNPPVRGVLAVTVILNFFGFSYVSMLPVIGIEKLAAGPALIGILTSMQGAGSLLGLLLITLYADERYYMRLFMGGSLVLLTMILTLSLVPWYAVAIVVLFAVGLGDAGFGSMQATIMFAASPPELRARNMGLLVVCIGFGPLGALHTGALAEWLGADVAVGVVALEGLIGTAFCLWRLPALRRVSL